MEAIIEVFLKIVQNLLFKRMKIKHNLKIISTLKKNFIFNNSSKFKIKYSIFLNAILRFNNIS